MEKQKRIDDWWSNRLGIPELTPRWVLQNWGTDVNRNMFHQDIWVASLERKLVDSKLDFVISDCRFINELKVLTNVNATLCRVDRGPLPEWHDTAVAVIKSGENIATDNRMSIDYPGVHISEWGWINTKVDYVIDNNFDLPYLKERIGEIIRDV